MSVDQGLSLLTSRKELILCFFRRLHKRAEDISANWLSTALKQGINAVIAPCVGRRFPRSDSDLARLEGRSPPTRYRSHISPTSEIGLHSFCLTGIQEVIDLFPWEFSPSMQSLARKSAENESANPLRAGTGARTGIQEDYPFLDNMFYGDSDLNGVEITD